MKSTINIFYKDNCITESEKWVFNPTNVKLWEKLWRKENEGIIQHKNEQNILQNLK